MDADPSKISGKFHESKGGMKESIGNVLGAPHLARSGQQERVSGQSEINAARSQGMGEGTGDIVDSPSSTVRGGSGAGAGEARSVANSGTGSGGSATRGAGSGSGLLDTYGLGSEKGKDSSARERTSVSTGLGGDQENLRGVGHGSGDLGSTLRDVDRKRNV